MRRHLQVFGRDKCEFVASLWIGFVGSLLWFLIAPPPHVESDAPIAGYVAQGSLHHAGLVVIAVVGWFCAANAWRDKSNTPKQRLSIILWVFIVTVWIGFRLHLLNDWIQSLPRLKLVMK
jgi:hypothetical protein